MTLVEILQAIREKADELKASPVRKQREFGSDLEQQGKNLCSLFAHIMATEDGNFDAARKECEEVF